MKQISNIIIIMFVASTLFAAETHDLKTDKKISELKRGRSSLLKALVDVDVALQAHGIESKNVVASKDILDKMLKDTAWRDLCSRTTKTSRSAQVTLEKHLDDANKQLNAARRALELIKIKEYETWIQTHPGEAKIFRLEERVKAAQLKVLEAALEAYQEEGTAGNKPETKIKWVVDDTVMPAGSFDSNASALKRKKK